MSAIAADILRDQQTFESQRFQHDSTNQRIADLIWPECSLFLQRDQIEGQRRDQFTFDSTGRMALERFSAATESILTPRTQRWHGMEARAESLNKLVSVKRYCEAVTNILFKARYAPGAGFTYASGESYKSLGAFGNQCIFLDDDVGKSLRYRSLFTGDIWIGVDAGGRPDRVHRKFVLNARQAKAMFGDKLPRRIAEAKNEGEEFDFIHCVKPRRDYDRQRADYRGKPWASYYVACCEQQVIEEGGYRTMPYLFSRFSTAPREIYGRGPASFVLPTLNTINEQAKTLLRAGQRAVDPPLMTVDDDALEGFSLKSAAINRGWLDANGQPLAVPFQSGSNIPLGIEFVQDSRMVINDAFFVTLFQILVEQPQMTATEALLRAQEKGELLGPSVGRQQAEFLDPMTERELDILSSVPGLMPDMPPELQEAGGFLAIRYSSPLDRMQRSGEGAAMLRWLESITPMAQVKPEVLNAVDPVKFSRELADIQGVPASVMMGEEEQAERDAADAEMQQAAQLVQAAPLAGKAAKDFAEAQMLANAQPSAVGLL